MLARILLIVWSALLVVACSSNETKKVCDPSPCGSDAAETEDTEPVATSTTIQAPSGNDSGLSGALSSASYDANTQIFTLKGVGIDVQMSPFPVANFGKMLAMRDANGIHNAYFGVGSGTQVVVYSGGTAGNVQQVAGYGRTRATELPLTGTAGFDGHYAGFTTTRRVNGTARLDVDFEGQTISGRITDRIFRQRPDNGADVINPLSMLVLEETSISAKGEFEGVTAGGQIVNGQELWNPATGEFEGLIGGSTGNEVVGIVSVTHKAPSGAEFEEIGGFIAIR